MNSKSLTPLNTNTEEYSSQEANILFTIHRIQEGYGDFEESTENADGIRCCMLPLHNFLHYLQHNQYPHPALLEYLGQTFQRVIDGEPIDSAFGMRKPQGRRPVENCATDRAERAAVGGYVYWLIHNQKNPTKLIKAKRMASDQFIMSDENVQRAYDSYRHDYELGQAQIREIRRERGGGR